MPRSLRATFGVGKPCQALTHVHQLLLCVELLGTAVPVAVGLIHSLTLGFPILLLQLFPNIQHAQQGVLGEHGQVSTPRCDPQECGDVQGSLMAWGVPGCPWRLGWRCHPQNAPLGIWHSGGCSGSTPASAAAGAGELGSSQRGHSPWSTAHMDAQLTWIQIPTYMEPHSQRSPLTGIPTNRSPLTWTLSSHRPPLAWIPSHTVLQLTCIPSYMDHFSHGSPITWILLMDPTHTDPSHTDPFSQRSLSQESLTHGPFFTGIPLT